MNTVRVRFGPSPTGFLHIGGLRTALFNWLWTKKHNGQFILRIEDTDRERFVDGAVENIIEALEWYGLKIDEGPVYQSKRLDLYKKYVDELLASDNAYRCFCTSERLDEVRKIQQTNKQATKYDRLCCGLSEAECQKKLDSKKPFVVRLRVPDEGSTVFEDMVYGKIEVANKDIDDQVLMKSDGFPTYHLANVVDDHEMKITHVIRAQEWLPSTPKHIILYQALGWELPVFAHLPMVLGPDRSKLSKRHGAMPALDYKKGYYRPEAVLNFIALLGWNPKTDKEIFSLKELVKEFDLSKVNKSNAIFNKEKLDWMNNYYSRNVFRKAAIQARADILEKRYNFSNTNARTKHLLTGTAELEIDRLKSLNDPSDIAEYTLLGVGDYDASLLVPKGESVESTIGVLQKVKFLIGDETDDNSFNNKEFLREDILKMIEKNKLTNKQVLWPLRVALTGEKKSPDVFDMLHYWGRQQALDLVSRAIDNLQKS